MKRKCFACAIFAVTLFYSSATAKIYSSNRTAFAADTERIFSVVEHPPQPKGGIDAFNKFFLDNIKYAFNGNESQLQGRIFLKFVVEKDGSLSTINILQSSSQTLTDASIRILKICPNWLPGTQNGNPVRVQYIVPINFDTNISKYNNQPVLTRMAPPDSGPDAEGIYSSVEIQPVPPGGTEGLGKFLQIHIHYPDIDRQNHVEGRVYLQFVVEKDGSLSSFKVLRAPSPTLGEEALRVLKLIPNWEPGKMHGEYVRVKYVIPVNFTLGTPRVNPGEFYQATLTKFIFDNVKYPKPLQDQAVSGNVVAVFVVDNNHTLSSVKIIQSQAPELNNEVMTLLQSYHPPENGPAGTFLVSFRFYVNEKPPYDKIPADIMSMGYFVVDAVITGSRYY